MNSSGKSGNRALIIMVLVFLPYALGVLFPERFWAFHYPAFLPDGLGVLMVFGAVIATVYMYKRGVWNKLEVEVSGDPNNLWRYGVPAVAAIFFYQFPIFNDVYGDAHFLFPNKDAYVEVLEQRFIDNLWSFDLTDSKIGTSTTVALIVSLAYYLGMTVGEVFRFWDAFCGAGYVFFMLAIVGELTKVKIRRLLLTIVVLGTPLVQVFAGHYEIYASSYVLIAAFWLLVLRYYKSPSGKKLLGLVAVTLLTIKFHITGVILLPVLVLILIYHVKKLRENEGGVEWRKIVRLGILPVYILGLFIYFGITKSAFGPRQFTKETYLDAIFLPIQSTDPAPLDRYNLFSLSHIFDYLSTLLFWSTSAILILLILFLVKRRQVNLKHPFVQISGYALLLYLPIFFVFNPLFSMPADWDIMGIPGVTLIVFTIALFGTLPVRDKKQMGGGPSLSAQLIVPVIGLAVIAFSSLIVNADKESEAKRIISLGKYEYKTYWIAASSYLTEGLNMLNDEQEKIRVHTEIVDELRPFAVKGNDIEYAQMLTTLAVYYRDVEKDIEKSMALLNEGREYGPMLRRNVYELVLTQFFIGDFESASALLPTLVSMEYPNKNKALRVAIHTSIEAGQYDDAEKYCQEFLKNWPDDEFILKVHQTLLSAENKTEILKLFRGG